MTGSLVERPRLAEVTRELKRDALLDAATSLLAELRWREISMEKVASRAGVSRQTIYNAFGSRSEFATAYVLREVEHFLDRFELAVSEHGDDIAVAIEDGIVAMLEATRSNPAVRAIVRGDADDLLALFTTRGRPVVVFASGRLANFLQRQWPWLADWHIASLADTLTRLAISLGALAPSNDRVAARSIGRLLAPSIEEARA